MEDEEEEEEGDEEGDEEDEDEDEETERGKGGREDRDGSIGKKEARVVYGRRIPGVSRREERRIGSVAFARSRVRACVRTCVRACGRACVRARERARGRKRAW